jgi:hypothetical protein
MNTLKTETRNLIDKIEEGKKSKEHTVTKFSIFNIQVCSTGTEDEALKWVQEFNPAGTSNNWQKSEQENLKPVPCANGGGRTHYVFSC